MKYSVIISDRQRARMIDADSPAKAAAAAIGKRLYSLRLDTKEQQQDGSITAWHYEATIVVRRPTASDIRHGMNTTEVRSERAHVHLWGDTK